MPPVKVLLFRFTSRSACRIARASGPPGHSKTSCKFRGQPSWLALPSGGQGFGVDRVAGPAFGLRDSFLNP